MTDKHYNNWTIKDNSITSPMEAMISLRIADGKTQEQTAAEFNCQPKNIHARLSNLRFKLNTRTTREAIQELIDRGILTHCSLILLTLTLLIQNSDEDFRRIRNRPRHTRTARTTRSGRTRGFDLYWNDDTQSLDPFPINPPQGSPIWQKTSKPQNNTPGTNPAPNGQC